VANAEKFSCDGCQREMSWKPEYAGRRIKCKHCGQAMTVPSQPNQPQTTASGEDDLYALSDMVADAHQAAAALPPTIVEAVAMPAQAPAAAAPRKTTKSGIPLAYQRPPTAREIQNAAAASHIDKNREVIVPLVTLVASATLYISYYAIHYHLGTAAIISTAIGLGIMTIFETALLFGFALAMAGPLGVSFGGIGTSILKFAAIAVLCDGVTTWLESLIFGPAAMRNGIVGYGAVGFFIALGIYWVTLIYFFAMDPGDSWFVVSILSVFAFILRMVLVLVLLEFILSFGGIKTSVPIGGGGGSNSAIVDEVELAKTQNVLHEAKQYATENGRRAEMDTITALYTAGAKNVWFQTSRDINGKGDAFRMVVELPDDANARASCYAAAKKYYADNGASFMAQSLTDSGDPYLMMPLP
jgi:hypothetical protein